MNSDRPFRDNKIFTEEMVNGARARLKEKLAQIEQEKAGCSKHITQQELESYLWGAAVLLRGLIDAGDYKQFIFPLLFYKRVSDIWEEEYQWRPLVCPVRRESPFSESCRCALERCTPGT